MRKIVSDYLKSGRRAAISQAYRKGYGQKGAPELEGWANEGAWPEE